jgi:DNA-directed RNA polymerase specialized sigma24 family protein
VVAAVSVLARRRRDQDEQAIAALLQLRDSVVDGVRRRIPDAGSLAIDEAVESAFADLLKEGAQRCESSLARNWWMSWATLDLKDILRHSTTRLRDALPVDEHAELFAPGAEDEALARIDDHAVAGLDEVVEMLNGREREWARVLVARLRVAPDGDGTSVRELAQLLGWSEAMTKKTGQRARETMSAFIAERAKGTICSRRESILDAYILATEGPAATAADADRREFQAVALHLEACPECHLAWSRRRPSVLARLGAVVMVPLDSLAELAHAAAAKLAAGAAGVHDAALALLARVGIGGVIGVSAKSAAVGVGVVCAACAATGELTGVLPPLLPDRRPELRQDAITPTRTPARAQPTSSALRRTPTVTEPPTPTRRTATKRRAGSSTTPTRSAIAPPPPPPPPPPPASSGFTPGDLPPASAAPPPPPPLPPAAAQPICTPGDLGC